MDLRKEDRDGVEDKQVNVRERQRERSREEAGCSGVQSVHLW